MQKLLLFVDKISTWVGHAFSWFIVGLTLLISWEVFSRYALDHPHAWAFDVMIMMYGTLFMMAGAYTLAKNGHGRGDVIYGFFTPRAQGILEIIRCIICIKQGAWPKREEDVQEVDVDKLKEELHVKDEDIQKLDQYVVAKEQRK